MILLIKRNWGLLFLMIICTFFESCKRKDTTTTESTMYANHFSYKKNGISQTLKSFSSRIFVMGNITYVDLTAKSGIPSETLNLYIKSNTLVGAYSLDYIGADYCLQFSTSASSARYVSNRGFISISKHDVSGKILEGIFNSKVYNDPFYPSDSVVITEGEFKIKY